MAFLQENLHVPLRKASLMSLRHVPLLLSEHPATVCSVLFKTQVIVFCWSFVSTRLDLMYRPLIPRAQKRLELMDPQKLSTNSCSSTGRSQGPDRLLGLFFNGNLGSPLSDFTYGGMGGALGVGHSLALPGHGETRCQ